MVHLVALFLVAVSPTAQPTQVGDSLPAARQAQAVKTRAPQLSEKQKAWFAHAIDDILDGK